MVSPYLNYELVKYTEWTKHAGILDMNYFLTATRMRMRTHTHTHTHTEQSQVYFIPISQSCVPLTSPIMVWSNSNNKTEEMGLAPRMFFSLYMTCSYFNNLRLMLI
jgi:hypothetical protein